MATHISIDEQLIQDALAIGEHTTKKAVVIEALKEYIQKRKQQEILKLFNTIEYDEDFDYKIQRQQK